jgi:competence protein ComEA
MEKWLATLLTAVVVWAHAGPVDVNQATQAQLESVSGIGPSIAGNILDERRKGAFKDWQDMIDRVKGVRERSAAKFSTEGLTVNGASYRDAAPALARKDDTNAAAAPATQAGPATTAAAADAKKADKVKAADANASEPAKK